MTDISQPDQREEHAPMVLWIDGEGCFCAGPTSANLLWGYDMGDLVGRPLHTLLGALADDTKVQELFHQAYKNGQATYQGPFLDKSGAACWGHLTLISLEIQTQNCASLIALIKDITQEQKIAYELRRVNRALKLLVRVNRIATLCEDELAAAQQICDALVESNEYLTAWIGFAEHDRHKSIRVAAYSGFETSFIENMHLSWVKKSNTTVGPTIIAVRTGKTALVPDIFQHEAFSPWYRIFERHGRVSALALPLVNEGQILGALTLMAADPGMFNPHEISLLEEMATGIAFAFKALRTEALRYRAVAELFDREERYRLALLSVNDGIWDWDLRANKVYYSGRLKAMLGYSEAEFGDSPNEWWDRVHPDDLYQLQVDIAPHINGLLSDFESEHCLRHKDGSYRWVVVRGHVAGEPGQPPRRIAGSMTDITDRKEAEERLRHDAMHDAVTSLPNRAYFLEQLINSIERHRRRNNYISAIMVVNIDRFNVINDSLGRAVGDQMLIAIGKRLKNSLAEGGGENYLGETVAHFGADEFAVLLDGIHEVADATRIAGRIHQELSLPFVLQGSEVFTTASIGITLTSANYVDPEDLLRDAGAAMFRAKASGRGRYQLFDNEMHAQSLAVLQLEAELRRAVERQEFVVYYQPIILLSSGEMMKVEALLRWQSPERGMVSPADFIPLAEETGLIIPIGEWVLNTACQQARAWLDEGFEIEVAVNISPNQLQDHNLIQSVRNALECTSLPPNMLHLEITENAAMRDVNLTIQILKELRLMGVQISVDDFGVDYSSLAYLKRFPVTSVKIDRSFIKDLGEDSSSTAITDAIIAMGHILNLYVIAEGVETVDQLAHLASQYCDEVQGFLMSRPKPADQLNEQLRSAHRWLPERPEML